MSRLTERELSVRGSVGYNKCYFTKCNALCSECEVQEEVAKKLKDYEDLEEQGLLLKLPCKCEEVVWVAEKGFKPHKAMYACPSAMLDDIEHGRGIGYTKEEAEAKLKELKNE